MSIAMATTYFNIIIHLFLFSDGKTSYSDFNCEAKIIKDTVYFEYMCENTKAKCKINEMDSGNKVKCYDKKVKKEAKNEHFRIIYNPCKGNNRRKYCPKKDN